MVGAIDNTGPRVYPGSDRGVVRPADLRVRAVLIRTGGACREGLQARRERRRGPQVPAK